MDARGEFTLLDDEKFDFDISLSPTSAKEDNEDDEVFVGPVGHTEKCVAVQIQESEKKSVPSHNEPASWSPLSGDKFVEIFKEAHFLALQLECFASDPKDEEPPSSASSASSASNPVVDKFVEESKTKLKLLDTFNDVCKTPVAIKRETYCIQDSPFHQLPPSVQQQIIGSKTKAGSTDSQSKVEIQDCQKVSLNVSAPLKVPKVVKKLPASPLAQKPKAPPPVKSTVPPASTGKTMSRLQPVKAPVAQTKNSLTVGKPKAAKKLSPLSRRNPSSVGSTEDLLSANSSIASDISDCSLNNSCVGQGKKTLNPPSKVMLNKVQFKTPSTSAGFRRNTSSSSSSRSSLNTSLNSSLSSPPAATGKLNATLNTSVNPSVNSRLKANPARLGLVRPLGGLGSSVKTANTDFSKNLLKPVAAANAKASANKPSSVSVAQPGSPAGKMQRQTSAPNLRRLPPPSKPDSAVKAPAPKPQARVMPTPTSRLRLPPKADGMSPDTTKGKSLKPMRLLSCGDIESAISQSTPIHPTKAKPINSGLPGRSIPATPISKLTSALPTPASRRTSGVLATPRTLPRAISSLRPMPALQMSSRSSMKLPAGSAEGEQKKPKAPKSPCSPTEDNMTTAEICCSLNFSPENKKTEPAPQIEKGPVVQPQNTEVLLIDIGVEKVDAKARKPSEKESQPLIDLSNTPEWNKQPIPLKPTHYAQLIDLSSPLIKLSPAANKENIEFDSPLLKF